MTFTTEHVVRFAHVDAAGIVFYPRYFELLNVSVEDWFAQVVGVDFRSIHLERRLGVPTVKLDSDFVAPSRLGDLLRFELTVMKLGRSSVELSVEVRCGGDFRFRARVILVCMDLEAGCSTPWPDDMRPRMA